MNDYRDHWWVEYLDKRPNHCCDCVFANEYVAYWWYPYLNPTCSKGHAISINKDACKDFKIIGRLGR